MVKNEDQKEQPKYRRPSGPRRFQLKRIEDASGVSGVGTVAEGVEWSSGKCAVAWLTEHKSVALYDSMAEVIAIHGHAGKTRVMWTDCSHCGHANAEHWMDGIGGCAHFALDGVECRCVQGQLPAADVASFDFFEPLGQAPRPVLTNGPTP